MNVRAGRLPALGEHDEAGASDGTPAGPIGDCATSAPFTRKEHWHNRLSPSRAGTTSSCGTGSARAASVAAAGHRSLTQADRSSLAQQLAGRTLWPPRPPPARIASYAYVLSEASAGHKKCTTTPAAARASAYWTQPRSSATWIGGLSGCAADTLTNFRSARSKLTRPSSAGNSAKLSSPIAVSGMRVHRSALYWLSAPTEQTHHQFLVAPPC